VATFVADEEEHRRRNLSRFGETRSRTNGFKAASRPPVSAAGLDHMSVDSHMGIATASMKSN
jgi:hypothetical protein